jgi:hypothetical protein
MPNGDFETRFGRAWRKGEAEGELSIDEQLEIEIDGLDSPLRIGGRIDRLAWNEDRTSYRVIDYKTGGTSQAPKDGSLKGGQALQLPLYLLAGARILGIDITSALGSAEYHYPTRKGNFISRTFSTDDLDERGEDFAQVLSTIGGGIRSGEFQMGAKDDWVCKWCDFDGICPTARFQQIERKAGDKVAKRFQGMRDLK